MEKYRFLTLWVQFSEFWSWHPWASTHNASGFKICISKLCHIYNLTFEERNSGQREVMSQSVLSKPTLWQVYHFRYRYIKHRTQFCRKLVLQWPYWHVFTSSPKIQKYLLLAFQSIVSSLLCLNQNLHHWCNSQGLDGVLMFMPFHPKLPPLKILSGTSFLS